MAEKSTTELDRLLSEALSSINLSQMEFGRRLSADKSIKPQTISSWKKRGRIPYLSLRKVLAYLDTFQDKAETTELARLKSHLNVMLAEEIQNRGETTYGSNTYGRGTYGGGPLNNDGDAIKGVSGSTETGNVSIRTSQNPTGHTHWDIGIKDGIEVISHADIQLSENAKHALENGVSKAVVVAIEKEKARIADLTDRKILEIHRRNVRDKKWEEESKSRRQYMMLLDESIPTHGEMKLDVLGRTYSPDYVDENFVIEVVRLDAASKERSMHITLDRILARHQLMLMMAKRLYPNRRCILVIMTTERYWDEYGIEHKAELNDSLFSVPSFFGDQMQLMGIETHYTVGYINAARYVIETTGNPLPRSLELLEEDDQSIDEKWYDIDLD